ncbi:MAG: hypothetical protein KAH05_05080 [Clostridiales bacterium]|nr:hypothetical protein [Clostridiales bacterium]
MAAADLALGRPVSIHPVPNEIIWFLLAKEFSWSPKQIKEMDSKDVRAITHLLSTYNRVKNQSAERAIKKSRK